MGKRSSHRQRGAGRRSVRHLRGAFNMTHGATLAGHVIKHAVERSGVDPNDIEGHRSRRRQPGGRDRAQLGAQTRPFGRGWPITAGGHDDDALLRVGFASHFDCRAPRHRRRRAGHGSGRRRVDQSGSKQYEHQVLYRRVADAPSGRSLHADDRDRRPRRQAVQDLARSAGRVFTAEPAAHGPPPKKPATSTPKSFRFPHTSSKKTKPRATSPRSCTRCRKTKAIAPTRRSKGSPNSRARA